MTDAITYHSIYLSSWITLNTYIPSKTIFDSGCLLTWISYSFLKIYEYLKDTPYSRWCLTVNYIQYINSVINIVVRHSVKTVYISSPISWLPEAVLTTFLSPHHQLLILLSVRWNLRRYFWGTEWIEIFVTFQRSCQVDGRIQPGNKKQDLLCSTGGMKCALLYRIEWQNVLRPSTQPVLKLIQEHKTMKRTIF
jgi:hypothetical protein